MYLQAGCWPPMIWPREDKNIKVSKAIQIRWSIIVFCVTWAEDIYFHWDRVKVGSQARRRTEFFVPTTSVAIYCLLTAPLPQCRDKHIWNQNQDDPVSWAKWLENRWIYFASTILILGGQVSLLSSRTVKDDINLEHLVVIVAVMWTRSF